MQIDRPIAIAIILFIILLLVFFLVSPEYKTFKKLRAELGEKIAEFNAKFDYYADITKTYYILQNHRDALEKVDDALPQEPNLGRIIYFFQKTAAENGLIIKDLSLSKLSKIEPLSNVEGIFFSINLIGDYESLGNFIVSLEKSARIFEITNISFSSESMSQIISPENELQVQQVYAFNLQVKTHSY